MTELNLGPDAEEEVYQLRNEVEALSAELLVHSNCRESFKKGYHDQVLEIERLKDHIASQSTEIVSLKQKVKNLLNYGKHMQEQYFMTLKAFQKKVNEVNRLTEELSQFKPTQK